MEVFIGLYFHFLLIHEGDFRIFVMLYLLFSLIAFNKAVKRLTRQRLIKG